MKPLKEITSEFAVLDVKKGRNWLYKLFKRHRPSFGPCPEPLRVPVVIHGFLESVASDDDGVSREFNVWVDRVEFQQPDIVFSETE